MNDFDRKLLTDHGWIIECEYPFEIKHKMDTEVRVTGWAVGTIIGELREEYIREKVREFKKALKLEMDK